MSSVKAQSMTCTPLAGVPGNATTPGLNALPAGFPVNKDGKIAWVGSKISDGDYVYHLTEAERAEIYKAVIAFKGRCHTSLVTLLSSLTRTPLLPPSAWPANHTGCAKLGVDRFRPQNLGSMDPTSMLIRSNCQRLARGLWRSASMSTTAVVSPSYGE